MDEKHVYALKRIALMGGIDEYIAVSSRELGNILEMSQQSASKRILELLDEDLIIRELGARKQRIRLTQLGIDAIRKEYNDYRRIFEFTDHIILHGTISDGMGEGGYYINQKGYADQFEEKLGFRPFQGTLNVTVDKNDLERLNVIRTIEGIHIKGFDDGNRTFGNVIAYKAKIRNTDCAIVMPERSSYSDVIEIVCRYHLRRTFGLNTGDHVDVNVELRDRYDRFQRLKRYFIALVKIFFPGPSANGCLVQSDAVNGVMTLSGWGIIPITLPAELHIPAISPGDPLGFHG